jgi:hypothetical protein
VIAHVLSAATTVNCAVGFSGIHSGILENPLDPALVLSCMGRDRADVRLRGPISCPDLEQNWWK